MHLRLILFCAAIVLGCSRASVPRDLVSHPPSSTVRTARPATPVVTVLRAGALVDIDSGALVRDQLVSIGDDGRIREVGAEISVPTAARVIDLSEFTILPGLFDAHTHLCSDFHPHWNAEELLVHSLAYRTAYRAILGVAHAREMLEAGFTTVRDLGNAGDYADVDLRQGIDRGLVVGPTMIPAGRIIAPYGGQFRWRVRKEVLFDPEYMFADTRDELRKAIRENIFHGAAVIKILADGQPYGYSEDDIAFIVAESAAAGRKVAAHCQTREGVTRALAAGVASIEHGWEMTDADFAVARKKNIALVSTDFTVPVLKGFGWDEETATKIHELRVSRLRRAYRAGVRIVFGSDVMVSVEGETRGTLAIGYVESFMEAGVPQIEILRAATIHAAELLGVQEDRGRLRAGFAADIIAVPGNPLEDISVLQRVAFVMKDGKIVREPST